MFTSLLALLIQTANPSTPATIHNVQNAQGWQVAGTTEGCVAHAAYRGGTVLSVFAMPDQEGIGFLLQNPKWSQLQDGGVYPLEIRFNDGSVWQIPAVARLRIDEDGPGLFFAVRPGVEDKEGRDFMVDFAAAQGMHVFNRGIRLDSLALSGSRSATVALAQCLSRVWNGGSAPDNPFADTEGAATAIRL